MSDRALPQIDDSSSEKDEFFIGWLAMPPKYVRFLGPIVVALLLGAGSTAALLAYLQSDPGTGQWDLDKVCTFDGIASSRPYAMIRVAGEKPQDPARTLLLVESGKFGARARLEQVVQGRAEGVAVRVTGTILHRDGRWLVELMDGEQGLRRLSAQEQVQLPLPGWPAPAVLAESVTLQGEIIDPKCYLGAMKPGGGKTHKACAMLCISGGVPPMLVTRDAAGCATYYLLVTDEGGVANEQVLEFVGEPVDVSGKLEQQGDLLILRIAAAGIRRRGTLAWHSSRLEDTRAR